MHTENLTILFVDIAGFTATTNRQSRRQNASLLQNFESLLKPQIKKFSGQLVKSIGDALLLSFRSPTDAMLCACRMQDRVAWHRLQHPQDEPIVIRIAAHLGEVRVARHDVFGEAVNLAARIEAVTPPGEIYLSEAVYLAMNKTEVPVQSAGQFQLDGFSHPLTLYQAVASTSNGPLRFGTDSAEFAPSPHPHRRWLWLTAALLLPAGFAGYFWWQDTRPLPALPPAPISAAASQFIYLDLTAIENDRLSKAEQFGVRDSLLQTIDRLQGLYADIGENGGQADYVLQASWRYGVYPEPDLLTFQLSSKTQTLTSWKLQWQGDVAAVLAQNTQQFIAALNQSGHFTELYPAESQPAIPGSFYKQYLAALAALNLGEQNQHSEHLETAVRQLQQIRQALPEFHQAARALCRGLIAWYEVTDNTETLDEAGPACRHLPLNHVTDQLIYARYLTLVGEKQSAQRHLTAVLATTPKSAEAYTLLSQLYEADQQPLEAELILQRAITAQPNHWPAIQMMALFHLERGQLSRAVEYLQRVIALAPQNATALTNLGSAYLLNGQLQAAADTYYKALQKSQAPFIQANLATVYYYLGRLKEAIALYQQALQQNQLDYVLHGNIADAYRQNKQLAEASLHYQQAISLVQKRSVNNARDLALLAHYQAQTGALAAAQQTMQQALQTSSEIAEVWLLDAILQTRLGQYQSAISSAEQALKRGYPAKLLSVDPDLQKLAGVPAFLSLLNPNVKEKL